MTRVLLYLILVSASITYCSAQDAILKLNIAPVGTLVYIDGEEQIGNKVTKNLSPGPHRISAWRSNLIPVDTTITFVADSTHTFYTTLRPSIGARELFDENKKASAPLLASLIYTGGVLVPSLFIMQKSKSDAEKTLDEYNAAPVIDYTLRSNLRADYNKDAKRYNTLRTTNIIASILVYGGSYYVYKKQQKKRERKAGELKKDRNPFAPEVGLLPYHDLRGTIGFQVTMKL